MSRVGLNLFTLSVLLISSAHCGGGTLDFGQAVQDLVETFTEPYKVVVTNTGSNQIYLKCASADDTIMGDGSDADGWWTVDPGKGYSIENFSTQFQALGWGFVPNNWGTTCFWCYANNNGQGPRDSGNWYIHQDVWGWDGCNGPANQDLNDKVTSWEVRDDGMYSNMCQDCQDGTVFEKYADWGPAP